MITNLLSHLEAVSGRTLDHPWKCLTTEAMRGNAFLNAVHHLVSDSSGTERAFYSTIFKGLFPHQKEWMGNPVGLEVDIQLPRTLQPSFPLYSAFDPHYGPRSCCAQLPVPIIWFQDLTLQDHWRPCTCKQQMEFAMQSRRSKNGFKVGGGHGTPAEVSQVTNTILHSQKTSAGKPSSSGMKERGGTFQGDWSF